MIDETAANQQAAVLAGQHKRQDGAAEGGNAAGGNGGFQQTLAEIQEKGFTAYVKDLQAAKLEAMRKEILESMGLTEDMLNDMSPEKRAAIDDMIAARIRQQLASSTLAEKGDEKHPGDLNRQLETLPNGLGSALLVLQALENEPEAGGGTR